MFELGNLTTIELTKILKEEQKEIASLRKEIKSHMLRVSQTMKKYTISTKGIDLPINLEKGSAKLQLINRINEARAYKAVLKNQLETIKGISEKDILHKFFTSQNVDNIEVSKQVEILRNIGYSEEEIDVILAQVRGDEDYEELRDKAEQIILEWYLQNGGEEGFEPVNPYAI